MNMVVFFNSVEDVVLARREGLISDQEARALVGLEPTETSSDEVLNLTTERGDPC